MLNRFWGAVLLVSGTTIGAGMLALPVTTGLAGFIPACLMMMGMWLYMLITAFYLLEVNLRVPGQSNLISMMGKTLGLPGQMASWVIYLFLLYALVAAYMVGCSEILSDWITSEYISWPLVIFFVFSIFVYVGTSLADFINRFMMVGLVLAYGISIVCCCCKVEFNYLQHVDARYLMPAISVLLTTFGFHIIIPTLSNYLDHQVKPLKASIFVGSVIPLVIYLFWQFTVIGVVPLGGPSSLMEANSQGMQITFFLQKQVQSPWMGLSVRLFAFFAIVTSLMGVSLSLHDFLVDGLKVKKGAFGKILIILFTFLPPLFFTLFYPRGFVLALEYAGICVALLLGLFPALMAWSERYGKHKKGELLKPPFVVWGGKPLLITVIILSLAFIIIEICV